jgi:hypothetical protein
MTVRAPFARSNRLRGLRYREPIAKWAEVKGLARPAGMDIAVACSSEIKLVLYLLALQVAQLAPFLTVSLAQREYYADSKGAQTDGQRKQRGQKLLHAGLLTRVRSSPFSTANSFKSYACRKQDATDSEGNPKPLAGENLPLRENPV